MPAARRKNAVRNLHNVIRKLKRRYVDPADNIPGEHLPPRLHHKTVLGRSNRAFLSTRMRAENNGVFVLRQISALKIAVEVGFVVGITAAISPSGSAIFWFRNTGSSSITSQVLYVHRYGKYIRMQNDS